MGNWYCCCVIIKAPSDDDQAVIYYMENFRATVLPGMDVCLCWRRLKERLSISRLWQVDLVLSVRYFAGWLIQAHPAFDSDQMSFSLGCLYRKSLRCLIAGIP